MKVTRSNNEVAIKANGIPENRPKTKAGALLGHAILYAVVGGVGIWAAASHVLGEAFVATLAQALIFGIFAMGVGFLYKHNAHVSFGHATWFGLAAYFVGIGVNFAGIAIEIMIPFALLIVAALATAVGTIIVRLSGVAFGMLTLSICAGVHEILAKLQGPTGGADGMVIQLPPTIFGVSSGVLQTPTAAFVVAWTTVLVLAFLLPIFAETRLGRLTLAIRENEERVRFLGYTTYVQRIFIYSGSAVISALAGIYFGIYTSFISPEALDFNTSGQAMIMALIGGTSSAWGPVLGALLFFLVRDRFGILSSHWMLPLGVVLIFAMAAWPTGIYGAIERLRSAVVRRISK
jgi:branched-chain amino acid transport system permease protein